MENDLKNKGCGEMKDQIEEPIHLAGSTRPAMPVAQRAKQFMPFAAVTGLDKALEDIRREVEERKNPCDSPSFML